MDYKGRLDICCYDLFADDRREFVLEIQRIHNFYLSVMKEIRKYLFYVQIGLSSNLRFRLFYHTRLPEFSVYSWFTDLNGIGLPQRINFRPPFFMERNELETLFASPACSYWIKIAEFFVGPKQMDPPSKPNTRLTPTESIFKLGAQNYVSIQIRTEDQRRKARIPIPKLLILNHEEPYGGYWILHFW